ncbi:VWA domain-containing protein [Solirubrobacter sp. CPCC 204708]|uniref:VWA domain-containing protein n=1 Tax=Solirubrobacter deserti TaxID=2282478 RepID=A0ABT4RNF9_9ACTN|nr:vWA domain-containing protein [Solirubrobacter deserti]MBE2318372.1 VWA domain-containing protein [Solirubrobacter deserti]MDA0140108.1 VWA domain-containing protein [Solirubrobacter deserti]
MASTTRTGPAPFAQQLHRAAAQRGRLDPLYQDLSEQLTRILQRLYPVWALIGPGLSDPGHIELHSRWIYLDADELLGTREQLMAGTIPRRRVLGTFGVALHETFHGKHTKRWAMEYDLQLARSDDPAERQLAEDRRLLEEPRMEAHGCRDFPPDSIRGRFTRHALQTAVTDTLVPRFAAELLDRGDEPVTRELAGRAAVYLRARTLYGAAAPAALGWLEPIWASVLGPDDVAALDASFAGLIWIADGDLDGLDDAARAYREIIGSPDEVHADAGTAGAPTVGTLAEALEQAEAVARSGQLVQLEHDVDLQALLEDVARAGESDAPGPGAGTGAPSGRMPDRRVDRPPFGDEIAQARRYATRMRQAMTLGTRTIDKRTPGGRFDGRAYARGQAQRTHGRPVSTHPWQITRQITAPIQEPHVALVIDTSGSMAGYEYALGPIAWILTDGLRQIGGRCAIALFGSGAELLSDGSERLRLVPGIRTGGGTAFAGDALVAASDRLDMTNPRRPRFAYVLSDGGWYDTPAGVERIHWLADHGVPTIHIAIGIAPLSVEADRIVVIDDPADALDQVAADTVAALRGRHTPRRP